MSKPTTQAKEPPAAPAPKRNHMLVEVPDDLRKSAIQAQVIASLCRIGGGDFIAELDEDLQTLVSSCITLGKKGKLVITLAVEPNSFKKLAIKPKIDLRAPKVETVQSILYATEKGQLLTRDPDQMEMDLKVVSMPEQPAREVL